MSFKVTIGKRDPKAGSRLGPTHNVTVSAPRHLFTRQVENWLFLQGLNRLNGRDGLEVWSTRYTSTPPAIYIAAYMDWKHGAHFPGDTRRMLEMARGRHDGDDDIGAFLGAAPDAGNEPLKIAAGTNEFIANCSNSNMARRQLLEGAGWMPLRNPNDRIVASFGERPYITRDPLIAANLEPFMIDAARTRLGERMARFHANIKRSNSHEAPADFAVPAPDDLDYLPFQKTGIQAVLDEAKGGIIADDMGLGKTMQAIGIINGRPQAKRILVFCQANMRLKWPREIEKWIMNKDLSIGYAEGDEFPDTDIVVINYDIAKRHEEKLRAVRWDLVFTDEAHNLKNEEAQRTLAILGTLKGDLDAADFVAPIPLARGGFLTHLTGTPRPTKTEDLWALLSTSRPDIWGKGREARQAFMDRYAPPRLIEKKVRKGTREFTRIIPLAGDPIRQEELQMRMRGSGSFIRA